MHALVALALISTVPGPPSELLAFAAPRGSSSPSAPPSPPSAPPAYLRRPTPRSARFLDHGVLALGVAGGTPHLYRLDLRVGLFDHLSLGLTGHWLPGQSAPQLWPIGSLALWRYVGPGHVGLEIGGHYRPVLYPPVDPGRFVPMTHFALGSIVISSGPFSAGLDAGAAHSRFAAADPKDPLGFRPRTVFGGGVFARVGTRRAGLTFDALAALGPRPLLVFEVAVEVRIGAFEKRPRGGWDRF